MNCKFTSPMSIGFIYQVGAPLDMILVDGTDHPSRFGRNASKPFTLMNNAAWPDFAPESLTTPWLGRQSTVTSNDHPATAKPSLIKEKQ